MMRIISKKICCVSTNGKAFNNTVTYVFDFGFPQIKFDNESVSHLIEGLPFLYNPEYRIHEYELVKFDLEHEFLNLDGEDVVLTLRPNNLKFGLYDEYANGALMARTREFWLGSKRIKLGYSW